MSMHRGSKSKRSTAKRGGFDFYPRTNPRRPEPGPKPHPDAELDEATGCWTWTDPDTIAPQYRCAIDGCKQPPKSKSARYCGPSHAATGANANRAAKRAALKRAAEGSP